MTAIVDPGLAQALAHAGDFNADACMNCGVCTAICPMEAEVEPRKLFRYVLLGLEAQVKAESESVFSCLLCKMCEENCPWGVRIAENVRLLRHHLVGMAARGGRG